ncbi:hypothetical protein Curi_c06510 [Gottschalkia acidurici 9a]|uniref:Uncharacterized protein n=1 Tax=Gottschalkia acidurici (strain ATCC 7906 / DSM 604 / BCRC 14475 / CIP 104303 / KCTC 5404 / NCIMB 10678 / 9a) TaxID=1128398 RepID=K0AWW2_GOTA9|nr:hypothetical protein [Gottschalkia acidurici]AFS77724.1 hypothetical protein Curi_c06510 [Gottschalkia acidurici 9a]
MAYMLNSKVICDIPGSLDCQQIDTGEIEIRSVNDIVIHGRVVDCQGDGIEGAVVKIFRRRDNGTLRAIDHTFSGCEGFYMINIPRDGNDPIVVMTSASTCNAPEQCSGEQCDLECNGSGEDKGKCRSSKRAYK